MGKRKTVTLLVAAGLLAGMLGSLIAVTAQTRGAAYIVRLREQADLTAVRGNRVAVQVLLQATARRTQSPLLARLEQWRREGKVRGYQSLWIINAITVQAPASEVLDELRGDAAVESVKPAQLLVAPPTRVTRAALRRGRAPIVSWGIQKIGADTLWARTPAIRGAGVRVGVIDTGIDGANAEFNQAGKIAAWKDFVGTPPQLTPYDDNAEGHGTHAAGTIAGLNQGSTATVGIAPGATLIVAKALDATKAGTSANALAAAQWVLDPDGNPNTADGADVVNCSLGSAPHADDASDTNLQDMVTVLRAANVFPAFAIGNSGPGAKTTASPGDYPNAVGVGATSVGDVDPNATPPDPALADFVWAGSSRGPVVWSGTTYTKPDVTAPGQNILSCVPGGPGSYGWSTGTSNACPHVSGAVALAISAARAAGFTPTVESLIAALKSTATDLGAAGADSDYGAGRINAVAFADAISGAVPAIYKATLVAPATGSIVRSTPTLQVSTAITGGAVVKFKVTITKPDNSTVVYDQTSSDATTGSGAFDKKAQAYAGGQIATVTIAALPTGQYSWKAASTSDGGSTWIADSDASTFTLNQAPSAAAASPADAATVTTKTPTLQVTVTDADASDALKVKILVSQGGTVVRTFDQTASATGWDKTSYANGETASYTVQTADALGAGAYTWTAQASDSKEWSSATASRSFTVEIPNTTPGTPVLVSPADGALLRPTPTFQVTVSDADDGDTLKAKIVISQNGTAVKTFDQAVSTTGWDKTSYASGETATLTVPAGDALVAGAYTWTATVSDAKATSSAATARSLTVNQVPSVSLSVPAADATVSVVPTLQVTVSDADAGDTIQAKVVLLQNGTAVLICDQTASTIGWDKASYANGETASFTVPAANALAYGQYQWTATAYDGKEWAPWVELRTLTIANRAPAAPEQLAPAQDSLASGTPTFQFRTTDADPGVTLRYKLVLTQGTTTVAFDQTQSTDGWSMASYASGETATFTVASAGALAAGQYTWQALAYDGNDWSQASATRVFTINADVPKTVPAALGTFALSLNLAGATRTSLGLTTVPMKVYNPTAGAYADAPDALEVGRGYWLKPGTAVSLSMAAPAFSGTLSIPLKAGWNFISSPFAKQVTWSLSALQAQEAGGQAKPLSQALDLLEDYAWGFQPSDTNPNTGSYFLVYDAAAISGVPASQLAPWRGYWVRAIKDCNLLIPDPNAVSGASAPRASASGWSVPVQVCAASGARTVVLGVTSGRALAVGQPPQPPTAGSGLSAALVQNGTPLAVDVRSGGRSRLEWELVVEGGASETDVVVTPDLRALPKDLSLTLIDTATGAQRYLRTSAAYRFRPNGEPRRLRIVAQQRGSVLTTISGIRMMRTRSGARAVQFTLSRAATVDVEILSPAGGVVATLARSRASEAGVNLAAASDRMARGIYLVRVRATTEDGATVQAVRLTTVTD